MAVSKRNLLSGRVTSNAAGSADDTVVENVVWNDRSELAGGSCRIKKNSDKRKRKN